MTLQVSFEHFPETVERLLGHREAYVASSEAGSLATAAHPDKALVVASLTAHSPEVTIASLRDLGMSVHPGSWIRDRDLASNETDEAPAFIAAVAYRSVDDKPGLWVDAFPSLPTQVSVLRAMYDEFRSTGEVEDVGFEEFVQLANANVVVVSPQEIEAYLRQKQDC